MIRELTDAERDACLTQAEVDALDDGAVVRVKWNGGNGPHTYQIERVEGLEHPATIDGRPLDYVGQESPRMRVFRPDDVDQF
jgi:hypothetical protein